MLSLNSKTCTKISLILLILLMILTSLYDNRDPIQFCFIMVACWGIGGVNLIFISKIKMKCLKRIIILLDILCIYGWLFYLPL
ncbi:hypothetical protein BH747_04730 [Enterococcus villorum]|uniref:Uncharacterized protein n=1 Tax=Enterococcus villorum TaxID=112904 RepID=A0A1V8YV89_9ENTE|nr:hypothetical protein [Enterococcus villorum]OQO70711.1 hypothetical protein BH747_04730 [Enterococcus villorum]OQO76543.1 hypothetical protein BH744_02790 [Enterococcus villorum]